jgi:hypothetical protein
VDIVSLTSGRTRSCGCLSDEVNAKKRRARSDALSVAGQRIGDWQVLEEAKTIHGQGIFYRCRCACGTESLVSGSQLRKGRSKGCGCAKNERSRHRLIARTGIMTRSPEEKKKFWRELYLTHCRELDDVYVRSLLVPPGSPITAKDVPQEMIDVKRQLLKLKRLIKEKRKCQQSRSTTSSEI